MSDDATDRLLEVLERINAEQAERKAKRSAREDEAPWHQFARFVRERDARARLFAVDALAQGERPRASR